MAGVLQQRARFAIVDETRAELLIVIVEEKRATLKITQADMRPADTTGAIKVAILPIAEEYRAHLKVAIIDE